MSRLSKNIVYNLVGQCLLIVLSFVAVKYIFSQLREDALGIIYFATTLNIMLLGILDKGIYTVTTRVVSTYINQEPEYIHYFIKTWSSLCWGVYLIFAIVVYFTVPIIVENWINLKTLDTATATNVLHILGFALLSTLPISFYSSLLCGLQRMEYVNIVDVSASALQQFGIIFIIISGGDLYSIAYWTAACYGLRVLIYIVISSHFFTIQSLIPGFSIKVVIRNFEFTLKMVNISILAMVHRQADKLIISKFLPIAELGYYGFAYGAVARAGLIANAVAQATFPSFCYLYQKRNQSGLFSKYEKTQDFISFVTAPIFSAVPFLAMPLFTFIFNEDVARTIFLPVCFLSLGFYLNGTLSIPYRIVLACGKPEITVRQNVYSLFLILPLILVLVYSLGLLGAALGWVLYFLFGYVYSIPRTFSECLEKTPWLFFRHQIRVFILTTLSYGLGWIILTIVDLFTIFSLSIAFISASTIYFIGAYFMIGDELRKVGLAYLRILTAKLNFKAIVRVNDDAKYS